jgi:hypothetical protein
MGRHCERRERPDGKPPDLGCRALMQRSTLSRSRSPRKAVDHSATDLTTSLVPPAGGRRIRESLSILLAESGRDTRLAPKSRVWTPRSHRRCRSNASTSAARAFKHCSDQLRTDGAKPDGMPLRRQRRQKRPGSARCPEEHLTIRRWVLIGPKAVSARDTSLAELVAVTYWPLAVAGLRLPACRPAIMAGQAHG